MTENAVRFLAKNELGHFSTARFWLGPSLDWQSPHFHLMGFLCSSSLLPDHHILSVTPETPSLSEMAKECDVSSFRSHNMDSIEWHIKSNTKLTIGWHKILWFVANL